MTGEPVASEKVTIHDNGLLPGYPGSYAYDDEGIVSQDTVLIENGRLVNFLHSRSTAARFGVNPTGSGRRQNFKFPPLPRMRNTYISAGDDDPEEIIRSTKKGIYAADVGFGGQVDRQVPILQCQVFFCGQPDAELRGVRVNAPDLGLSLVISDGRVASHRIVADGLDDHGGGRLAAIVDDDDRHLVFR